MEPDTTSGYGLAGETEVVTRDGIRPIRELAGGTHEMLIPNVTNFGTSGGGTFRPGEVRDVGVRHLLRVALNRHTQRKVIYAAPGHRWLVQQDRPNRSRDGRNNGYDFTTVERATSTLAPGDRLRSARANRRSEMHQVRFAVAQGFVFGDGTKGNGGRPASLTIYDNGKDDALLPYFAGHEVTPVVCGGVPGGLIYGLPRTWKNLPDLRESRQFLLSWLAGYFAADGCVPSNGGARLYSARRENLEFARCIAAVCGVGYGPTCTGKARLGLGSTPSSMHSLALDSTSLPPWFFLIATHRDRVLLRAGKREQRERMWRVQSVEACGRMEPVYCAPRTDIQAFALSDDLMTGA